MRRIIFSTIIIFFYLQNLSGQVRGIVIDSAVKNAIQNAIVAIAIKSDIADTLYTITNLKGEFIFEKVPLTNFSLIVSGTGYQSILKHINVKSQEKTIDLGNIYLNNLTKILDAIVIRSSPIIIKEDTVEYKADAFKVKENAVVEDLLKKLPGVQVDKDGNIKAQGKPVTKVKVNGKDFFGGDPKTATKELPANIVAKVQIIDDYGDQATVSGIKDGESQKIMNIQLKKDKNRGYFGRVTIGAGSQGRYQASFNGNYFKNNRQISVFSNSNNTSQSLFNFGSGNKGVGSMVRTGQEVISNMGGSGTLNNALNNGDLSLLQNSNAADGITVLNSLGINYRDEINKRITVYGSYSYAHRSNTGYKIISQQILYSSGLLLNNQNNNFINKGDNHRLFFNIEYNIDSFNYLKISPNISFANSSGTSKSIFDYADAGYIKTSDGYYNTISSTSNPNFNGAVLYNHKFRKRGRNFSMNINAGASTNTLDQDAKNNTNQYTPSAISVNRFTFNTQQNDNYNYGIRFTYSEPLSKAKALDFALSHNLSYAKNNRELYDVNPLTGKQILNISNSYQNKFYTNRANISLRTTEKKYNYALGISIQPVNLIGISITKDSAYHPIKKINVFPVARFAYNFSKTKSVNFNYRGDAQQPGFGQLQDVRDSSNLQYQTNGNPNLKPAINHSLNLFYNNFNFVNGQVLFSSLSISSIQNQIINKTTRLDNGDRQLTVPQNINGYYSVSSFYNFSKPYKNRKYVINVNGSLNYTHNINLIDSLQNVGNNWVISQGFTFELNHKDWLEFNSGINYNLNYIKYNNADANISLLQNDVYSSWNINSSLNIDIPENWILKYDFDYTINHGLTGNVGKNTAILNASIEKQFLKKKNGILRLQGLDLFNQSANINRTVSANSIIDSRSNRLARYYMVSFIYRIQKFAGK